MAKWRCNSCNGEYSDGLPAGPQYFHACPAETITHAICDKDGNVTTPEKREPLPNRRDENIPPDLVYIEGKPMRRRRDPNDVTHIIMEDADSLVISEGAGRTLIAP